MLTFFSKRTGDIRGSNRPSGTPCPGTSRRDFFMAGGLALGGLTFGGLTLSQLLQAQASGAADLKRRGKSVIVVFLSGGPSHIDMFDLKPNAPVEIRGEFSPIRTKVPGIEVCELMPRLAGIADKWSVVQGVRMIDTHSAQVVMTGFGEKEKRPVFGSVVSKIKGSSIDGLPTYVALGGENSSDPCDPAFLGAAHRPFKPGGESMSLTRDLPLERFDDRKHLLTGLDKMGRQIEDLQGNMAGHTAFSAQALEMLSTPKARQAFDVKQEPAAVREKFAPAERLLVARRLVEAGVPVVTLSMAGTIVPGGDWDTHAGGDQKSETNFSNLRRKLPVFDRGIHALITDLYERGLDKDVMLVVCGEFGRTPKINKMGGRDHWAPAGSVLFAGGGLRMGQAIGDTGPHAEQSRDHTYSGQSVLATIYHHLGVNPEVTINDLSGRPRYLLDDARKIRELI